MLIRVKYFGSLDNSKRLKYSKTGKKYNNVILIKRKQNYKVERIITQGDSSIVYLVTDGQFKFAVKRILEDKRYKNRELEILSMLDHQHIVKLVSTFMTPSDIKGENYINLVTDFMPDNLDNVIADYNKNKQIFPNMMIKIYAYQIIRALAYIHGMNVVHRDIKPDNILIDNMFLKLCDFGSAKRILFGEESISYICSRNYRAPELILGATHYDGAIDMWSVGCVLGEMILCEPLFQEQDQVGQLIKIMSVLGTPDENQIAEMNPLKSYYTFPIIRRKPLISVFQGRKCDPLLIDLVSRLLQYSPGSRLKAHQALLHPYFDELRQWNFSIRELVLPDFFNFSKEEQEGMEQENIMLLYPKEMESVKGNSKVVIKQSESELIRSNAQFNQSESSDSDEYD